jgi:hypothetical protein
MAKKPAGAAEEGGYLLAVALPISIFFSGGFADMVNGLKRLTSKRGHGDRSESPQIAAKLRSSQ